ncbi:MAG: response regulator [Deltaproteobacteria bacterium]|nr:response regulator [Deltaproteobacteria bacterium]
MKDTTKTKAQLIKEIEALREQLTQTKETARKYEAAEKALVDSEEKYRLLFNALDNPITVLDREGVVLHINEAGAKNLGATPEKIVGKNINEFFLQASAIYMERARKVLDSGHGINTEDMVDLPSGRRWFLSNVQPIEDKNSDVIGVQVISTDITALRLAEEEQRHLESQIQHAQKLESLGVLAGGIAHDFNNLLMGILGNADLALKRIRQNSPGRDHLLSIMQTSTHAADLCKQMLAYSGKGSFVVNRIDLNALVEEMTHLLDVSISKQINLKYDCAVGLPAIEADATQIRQVIMNLITNASEAIGENPGVISVTTSTMVCKQDYMGESYLEELLPKGTYVYLDVSDTGCGMDKRTLKKIFDPFYSTKFTGRGLGLSAVLGIVRGHKGIMKVNSKPEKGSTFRVLFPALDEPAQDPKETVAETDIWTGTGTVLLVDDEDSVREVAKDMLEEIGLSVLTASDGLEAIEQFRAHENEIDCLLLDLTMPRMDGEETFAELRRLDKNIPVVLSSGYNEQEIEDKFLGKGLAGFIQKPYRVSDLVNILKVVLDR